MKTIYLRFVSAIAVLAFFSMTAPNALAQCGLPNKVVKPASWLPQSGTQHGRLQLIDDDKDNGASIVGMWHVVFTGATVNSGPYPVSQQPVDNAIVVWHRDGTEIMNSNRPAQDGNFCLGVWARTGERKYHLNHIPWQGNDPSGGPAGIGQPQAGVQLTEDVTLSQDGNSYTGSFTLVQYDSAGNVGVTITGSIQATRITPTTPFTDLL
jgi:hypothetical protein